VNARSVTPYSGPAKSRSLSVGSEHVRQPEALESKPFRAPQRSHSALPVPSPTRPCQHRSIFRNGSGRRAAAFPPSLGWCLLLAVRGTTGSSAASARATGMRGCALNPDRAPLDMIDRHRRRD